jgi:hypothetical protein
MDLVPETMNRGNAGRGVRPKNVSPLTPRLHSPAFSTTCFTAFDVLLPKSKSLLRQRIHYK